MLSKILFFIGIFALAVQANFILPTTAPSTEPPNCGIILNSPQFAWFCRLAELDTPLSAFGQLSANQICAQDCRCVMGATARGGKCQKPVGKNEAYCVCDYGREDPEPFPFNGPSCGGTYGNAITHLCPNATVVGPFFDNACDHDCQCSHGYGNTHDHVCTTVNGDPTNTMTYCVCGGGQTLAVQ